MIKEINKLSNMIRVYIFQKGVDDYAKYSFPGNQNLERIYSFVIQMTIPLSDIHEDKIVIRNGC